jgi:hypothetical protein
MLHCSYQPISHQTPFRRIATGIARLDSFLLHSSRLLHPNLGAGSLHNMDTYAPISPFPLHAPYLHNYIRCRYFCCNKMLKMTILDQATAGKQQMRHSPRWGAIGASWTNQSYHHVISPIPSCRFFYAAKRWFFWQLTGAILDKFASTGIDGNVSYFKAEYDNTGIPTKVCETKILPHGRTDMDCTYISNVNALIV